MSKKLPPERKAKASLPLAPVQKAFIRSHLATGTSPKIILERMNFLAQKSREDLIKNYNLPGINRGEVGAKGRHREGWVNLAGTRQLTLVDVRRVYDALRKTPGNYEAKRKAALEEFRIDDRRAAALAPVTGLKLTSRRKLHDLGFARRFGADRELLRKLEDDALVSGYFTNEGKGEDEDEEASSSDLYTKYLAKLAKEQESGPKLE